MGKYIHRFQTQQQFEDTYENNYIKPWLSYTEGRGVAYNKYDPFNGYEYVDLGLPSGTLWAKCNVGTSSPNEVGPLFDWGEVEIKDTFGYNTYKWVTPGTTSFNYGSNRLTKYNLTDGKVVLDPEDDAAHVYMGGEWHMPSYYQLIELIDNTTFEVVGGIGVCTSKNNGATLSFAIGVDNQVFYCGDILEPSYPEYTNWGSVNHGNLTCSNSSRVMAVPVRGVIGYIFL